MRSGLFGCVVVWGLVLFAVAHDSVVRLLVAAAVAVVFLLFVAVVVWWVWEGYGPAARRARRGAERVVGPEGRAHLPYAAREPLPSRECASLGPAFRHHVKSSRPRGARRGARR